MLRYHRPPRNRTLRRPLACESLDDRNLSSSLSIDAASLSTTTSPTLSSTWSQVAYQAPMPSPRCVIGTTISLSAPNMSSPAVVQINSMVVVFDGSAIFSATITRLTTCGYETTPIAGWISVPRLGGSRISTATIHFSGFGVTQVSPGQFVPHNVQYDGTLELGWHSGWIGGALSDLAPGYGGIAPTYATASLVY